MAGRYFSTAGLGCFRSVCNRFHSLERVTRFLLTLTVALAVSAVACAQLRLALYVIAGCATTAVCGWRAAQQARPARRWLLSAVSLGCLTGRGAVQLAFGHLGGLGWLLTVVAAICALPAALLLAVATKESFHTTRGRWAEATLISLVIAGLCLQLATLHSRTASSSPGHLLTTWPVLGPYWPPLDVLLLCLLMRLIITRSYLPAGIRLQLCGSWLLLIFDLAVGVEGHRAAAAHSPALALGTLAMLVLGWGFALPSATFQLPRTEQYPVATGSVRLLSTFPLVIAVPAVWICGRLRLIPETSVQVTAVAEGAITLCALWLAVQCLRVVEDLAEKDAVTGVTNRRGLSRAVHTLLAGRGPNSSASLAVIDLDGFKQVNDRYGHSVGDGLLHAVAQRLRDSVGDRGAVCRIGGDEFVVVYLQELDTVPQISTSALSRRIAAALEPPCRVGTLEIQASASVGVTPLNRASDLVQVMVNSDAAMYAAKKGVNENRAATSQVTDAPPRRPQVNS